MSTPQQTKAEHARSRLDKRLQHEEKASRLDDNARAVERRGDHRGAALLRAQAERERRLGRGFL